MLRKLRLFLVSGLLLLPSIAMAVGLGAIKVNSALTQPFNASIPILQLGVVPTDELKVKLASGDRFKEMGIERPNYILDLKFKVERASDGKPYIRVTTDDPMSQPTVQFLLDISWPNGQLFREYTVFLDPPNYAAYTPETRRVIRHRVKVKRPTRRPVSKPKVTSQVATVTEPEESKPDTTAAPPTMHKPEAKPEPTLTHKAPEPKVMQMPKSATVSYGPTTPHDSMWHIATEVRPDPSLSIQQVMVGIFKNNPKAFTHHNINGLMAGQLLHVPPADKLAETSKSEAIQFINEQNQAWAVHDKPLKTVSVAKTGITRAVKPHQAPHHKPQAASEFPDELELQPSLPHDVESFGFADGPKPELPEDVKTLQAELAVSAEALGASKQQNKMLSQEVTAMEDKMKSMEQQMQSKDDEIIALEKVISEQTGTAAPTTGQPGAQTADLQSVQLPARKSSFMSRMMLPVLLAIIILLLVAGIYWQRRRAAGAKLVEADDDAEHTVVTTFDEETTEEDEEDEEEHTLLNPDKEPESSVFEAVDTVEEANVLIAYGRHSQAIRLLQTALEQAPEQQDVRVKLLEVYALDKNKDEFNQVLNQLPEDLEQTAPELWQKVEELVADWDTVATAQPAGEIIHDDGAASASDVPAESRPSSEPAPESSATASETEGSLDSLDDGDLNFEDITAVEPTEEEQEDSIPTLDLTDESDEQSSEDELQALSDEIAATEATQEDDDHVLEFTLDDEDKPEKPLTDIATEDETISTGSTSDSAAEASSDDGNTIEFDNDFDWESVPESSEVVTSSETGNGEDRTLELETIETLEQASIETPDVTEDLHTPAEATDDSDDGFASLEQTLKDFEVPSELHSEEPDSPFEVDMRDSEAMAELTSISAQDEDTMATKLDLARAYIDMGDHVEARFILEEVQKHGSKDQGSEAQELLDRIIGEDE
ncbi:MAG: hypothetical protein CMF50_02750 [Legionellales bacterium]|nr:hypothetical protein [Legionellales bacterium]|tara:strand:- start:3666 stop:6488 length:2823 start_codon:yes stop_codon:yes gene_type:complete